MFAYINHRDKRYRRRSSQQPNYAKNRTENRRPKKRSKSQPNSRSNFNEGDCAAGTPNRFALKSHGRTNSSDSQSSEDIVRQVVWNRPRRSRPCFNHKKENRGQSKKKSRDDSSSDSSESPYESESQSESDSESSTESDSDCLVRKTAKKIAPSSKSDVIVLSSDTSDGSGSEHVANISDQVVNLSLEPPNNDSSRLSNDSQDPVFSLEDFDVDVSQAFFASNGNEGVENDATDIPLPSLVKMVRMHDSTVGQPHINYDATATVTSDIDSIVLRSRFFVNLGLFMRGKNNKYSVNTMLNRRRPNSKSRFNVGPMVHEDDEHGTRFDLKKNGCNTSSVSFHDFPNVNMGQLSTNNIKMQIMFTVLSPHIFTNMFTKIQMAVIVAALNCAKLRYPQSRFPKIFWKDIENRQFIDFDTLEDFVVDGETKDFIVRPASTDVKYDNGFVLFSVFEEFLSVMARGKREWDKYDLDFTQFCDLEDLTNDPNLEVTMASEAKFLYNNRCWYLQHAGTKNLWPSRDPVEVNLSVPGELDRAVSELFVYDHKVLDNEIFNYEPFQSPRLLRLLGSELEVPQIAFDHAINVKPRNRGVSFLTSSNDVVNVLKKITGEYDHHEHVYRQNLFNTSGHPDNFPNCVIQRANDFIERHKRNDPSELDMDLGGSSHGTFFFVYLLRLCMASRLVNQSDLTFGFRFFLRILPLFYWCKSFRIDIRNNLFLDSDTDSEEEGINNMSEEYNAESGIRYPNNYLDIPESENDPDETTEQGGAGNGEDTMFNEEDAMFLTLDDYILAITELSHDVLLGDSGNAFGISDNEEDEIDDEPLNYDYNLSEGEREAKIAKYYLWLTRGKFGIANAHSLRHKIFMDFSISDKCLSDDESDETEGKFFGDIVVDDPNSNGISTETQRAFHLVHAPGIKIVGGQIYNAVVRALCNKRSYEDLFKKSNLLALMMETLMTHDIKSSSSNIIDYDRAKTTVIQLLSHLIVLTNNTLTKLARTDRNHVRIELFYEVGENTAKKSFPVSTGMEGLFFGLPFYPGPKLSESGSSVLTRCIKVADHAGYFSMIKSELLEAKNLLNHVNSKLKQVPTGSKLTIGDTNHAVRGGILVSLDILLGAMDLPGYEPKILNQFKSFRDLNPLQVHPSALVRLPNCDRCIFDQQFGLKPELVVKRRHMTKCFLNSRNRRGMSIGNARLSVTKELKSLVRDPISANITIENIDRAFHLYSKDSDGNVRRDDAPMSIFTSFDPNTLPGVDQLDRVKSLVNTIAQCVYDCLRRENQQTVSAITIRARTVDFIAADQVPLNNIAAVNMINQFREKRLQCPISTVKPSDTTILNKVATAPSTISRGLCINSVGKLLYFDPFII